MLTFSVLMMIIGGIFAGLYFKRYLETKNISDLLICGVDIVAVLYFLNVVLSLP